VDIIAKVGKALQYVFGEAAERAGAESGVIQRQRVFTAQSLGQTFVLGHLQNPEASDEELAQMAAQCGAPVSPQAIAQRCTPTFAKYLETLFREVAQVVVGSRRVLAPLLERFSSVTVLDSSTITLPDEMQEQFPGCGGGEKVSRAALKLQTEFDLRDGALSYVGIEAGRSPDRATVRQQARRGPGSLRIADLGYFDVGVFAAMAAAKEYFLSRLQYGTMVLLPAGAPADLLPWLEEQPGPFIDQPIILSKAHRFTCRLIAWRLPPAQASERRRKLRQDAARRLRDEPSEERLAWCDWTILVTNVPEEMLTPAESAVLYRARWQIELLFKRWKSQDLIAALSGATVARQMVRIWSRLIGALLQHWLLVACVWGDPSKSWSKACEAVRPFVSRLAAGIVHATDLRTVLTDLRCVVETTCRRNKRAKPGTLELLNDVSLLNFG